SAWTPAEQHDLAQFLRDIHTSATTKARVLLTSRRDEHDWLGGLPVRIALPPMPLRERVQLAANIIAKYPPHKLTDVADWRPLLRYTAGNPLTLTILVGQVLRTGTTTRQGIETFLTQLKAGEVGIDDDQAQGRTASLGASLSYGLRDAFTDTDRARLAALHLFHDHVDVDALTMMGAITGDDGQPLVPELAGLTREQGIALLDRAADIGILTTHGGGYYTAHPALPWYFTQLFTATYGPPDTPRALAVTRAYTRAISNLGNYYFDRIEQGQRGWLRNLADEEANLLHALHLARTHHWWDRVMRAMQGLRALYGQAGRRAEWARLVHDLTGDLTDPATDLRLPGREDHWSVFTNYRIRIARDNRDWPQAEHLQTLELDRNRQDAATALTKPADQLDDTDRNRIRNLGISLHDLADILREQGNPDCIPLYQEAIDLARHTSDRRLEATRVFNLGHAYMDISAVRDLDKAQNAYQHSLDLRDDTDRIGRARSLGQLGGVALERYRDARDAGQSDDVLLGHLNTALHRYQAALALIPADAVNDLTVTHGQLGTIFGEATRFDPRHLDTALGYFREGIRYATTAGNTYSAGLKRYNAAFLLSNAGRTTEALAWANAALRDYQTVGAGAQDEVDKTAALIAQLQS
ncbi:MAG TPA: tetratricopeptide repeat protein, partial [Mycobacterium sp.]